ncbi:uncharacterized protein PHACADRAFT_155862 [Phanerochaete carnosa HHB-10118-sp]|uniref:Las1-domain-containing protein n=1 Tax=Phanerochaete carnosa (strain HHB-10118-sp) TaxID=650164 RepID=K5XCN5_PHACS|nr:uncharacterized protein PHACADRAFT_155862 [Phanerochaete carnosa HHB-10118-sp]EKM60757.1 hypothetical protein PHACADRAFT_155862 [Phanerochaete carnosa HHB-10118-sp]
MRLPRRVPWSSLAELDEVCSWIYTDETDLDTKILAVQRLSAWKAITTLPHALDSTLSLLTVIVQDSSREGLSSHMLIRQAYAVALIRLVNGLVDPLQLGAYARSIASIAAQLGLPQWLVELRHAATHEDLPSLDVLREAAREAMAWLLQNYFNPALSPSAPPRKQTPPLRPLQPLLAQYKMLLKSTTRDASLRSQYKAEITQILRDIERWVAEAKVAADVSAATLEWDDIEVEDGEQQDSRERWALEKLCDTLLEKGGLVPLSKKKRVGSTNPFQPSNSVLAIWTPLLSHLQALHPDLQSVLISRIITSLLSDSDATVSSAEMDTIPLAANERKRDASYHMCVASWAHWLVTSFRASTADAEDETLAEEAAAGLITGLGPSGGTSDTKAARYLLDTLCKKYPALQATASVLLPAPAPGSTPRWSEQDLETMAGRLDALIAPGLDTTSAPAPSSAAEHSLGAGEGPALPPGWRVLTVRDGWKPAPIGVHVG